MVPPPWAHKYLPVGFSCITNLSVQETFVKNMGLTSGLLDRDKLEKIKLHHLPQMNITSHEHAKVNTSGYIYIPWLW